MLQMKSIVFATIHSWNIDLIKEYKDTLKDYDIQLIVSKEKLTYDFLSQIQPQYIFFPHWSWRIPPEIYNAFRCIVFHMTDLPFGRGGNPLQDLIASGIGPHVFVVWRNSICYLYVLIVIPILRQVI